MQSAMNFLKRRLSETSFTSNLPNGYLVDLEEPRRQTVPGSKSDLSADSIVTSSTASSPPPTHDAPMQLDHGSAAAPAPPAAKPSTGGFFSAFTSGNPLSRMKADTEQTSNAKILLVIDDQQTDWSKYFRGKKVHDYSVRVEQASFCEITLTANSSEGVTVNLNCVRDGNKVIKSFKPHFLLVRQSPRSMAEGEDFRNLIIGFKYGGIPSVNSLHSIYNFLDRPWTFAQLIRIQKRLGREKFPLISQTFYPSGKEMLTSSDFPVVVKIGHAHRGMGKLKVGNYHQFQDVSGVVAMTGTYAVSEKFVDSKFDIRVQKIGGTYRAYVRTSISNSWKANTGSAMLEEIPVSDSHRLWVDACSEMFGGLDVVAVKAVHGSDGQDYIIEVCDCATPLVGEKQEDDRQIISDLVLHKMNVCFRPRPKLIAIAPMRGPGPTPPRPAARRTVSQGGKALSSHLNASRVESAPASSIPASSMSAPASPPDSPTRTRSEIPPHNSNPSRNSAPSSPGPYTSTPAPSGEEDMKAEKIRNLRKSFASIFGD